MLVACLSCCNNEYLMNCAKPCSAYVSYSYMKCLSQMPCFPAAAGIPFNPQDNSLKQLFLYGMYPGEV